MKKEKEVDYKVLRLSFHLTTIERNATFGSLLLALDKSNDDSRHSEHTRPSQCGNEVFGCIKDKINMNSLRI